MLQSYKRLKRFELKQTRDEINKRPFNNRKRTKGRKIQDMKQAEYVLFGMRVEAMIKKAVYEGNNSKR